MRGDVIPFERRAQRAGDWHAPRVPGTWIDRVLVVGGAGYIGSVLCRKLIARGYSVRVLDALFYGDESLRELRADRRFELVYGDSRDATVVAKAVRGVDAVIHLGEIVGDPACSLDEDITLEINFEATRMIAEAAKDQAVMRFTYASSCSVYGASDDLLTETSPLNPLSLYARAKIEAEHALFDLTDHAFRPLLLRLATVYGLSYRPRFDLVVNVLAAKAATDGVITINGGRQWRPFVHVSDVARLMADTLRMPMATVGGHVFNVGSNAQNHTIREIGDLVQRCVPTAALHINESVNDADNRNYRVSFTKVERDLGFRPSRSVPDGIKEIVGAFASRQIVDYRESRYHNVAMLQNGDNDRSPVRLARYGLGPMIVDVNAGRVSHKQGNVA